MFSGMSNHSIDSKGRIVLPAKFREELGDILFSAVNVSRFVKADAEEALTQASDKFLARFTKVEKLATERSIDMKNSTLEQLDALWDEAKAAKESI